ncbi:hypothetical protein Tco_0127730 [Tanacetum coccineum]
MPKATTTDISLTKSYIPKVSKIPGISPTIAQFYKPIENRNIHEGRVVDQAYYKSNNIERLFTNIRFNCLFQINEPIVPRFILDFYSQVTVQTDEYGYLVISFMIQHEFITLTLAQFGQILKIPYNGQAVFTNEWDLASLEYSQETEGPYCTDLPTPDDIRRLLELERVVARHSVSSSSTHHQGTSSYQHDDDDDEDVKTSRASTPSPTTYLNSLNPLEYQNYQMPSASEQTDETLFERQTTLLNQTQQMHKEMRAEMKSLDAPLLLQTWFADEEVKGFMWCMQKAMARVSHGYGLAVANKYRFIQAWIAKRKSSFGKLEETSMDGLAGLVFGPAGAALGPAELAQKPPN